MTSRRDYIAIAAILHDARRDHRMSMASEMGSAITRRLAEYFAGDNPAFNREKFMTAATPADRHDHG